MALRRYMIERDIPKVGTFEREQLRQAAGKSNEEIRAALAGKYDSIPTDH